MSDDSLPARLFELLVNASFVVTLLVGLIWIPLRSRKGLSAAFRSMIWTATLVAILGLPVLFAIVPPSLRLGPLHAAAPSVTMAAQGSHESSRGVPVEETASVPGLTGPAAPPPPSDLVPLAMRCAIVVWFSGVIFVLGRFALGNLFLHARLGAQSGMGRSDWHAMAEGAARQLAVVEPVKLRHDEKITVPAVWGFRNATVFLPLLTDWSQERKRTILLHELAHIKRRDHQTLWLRQLVAAIYWFHPAVLFAVAESHLACEQASDDLVLDAGVSPGAYARHLLEISEAQPIDGDAAAFVGLLGARSLERRVASILNVAASRRAPTGLVRAVTTTMIVPLLVLLAAARPLAPKSEARDPVALPVASAPTPAVVQQPARATMAFSSPASATSAEVVPAVSTQGRSAATPSASTSPMAPDARASESAVEAPAASTPASAPSVQPITPEVTPFEKSNAVPAPAAAVSSAIPDPPPLAAAPPSPRASSVHLVASTILPGGTPLWLLFAHDVKSEAVAPGSRVDFVVPGDIRIGNTVVARAGTPGVGTVTRVKKAKVGGRSGAVDIRVEYLQVGSARITLSTAKGGSSADLHYSAPYAIKWPFGLFRKGYEMDIPSGTGFTAYVSEDVTLPVIN